MKFKLIFLFIILTNTCFSKGIIIADEQKQTQFFNSNDSAQIIKFADTISSQFDRVIIHLGKDFVFRKGNIFSTEISKRNLSVFCKNLSKQKVEIILWFFDSYGAENFIGLYKNHKEIINENITELTKMNISFDGIAVDLEWINLNNFENNDRFVELLKYLKNKASDKKIYFFTSLIDSPEENIKRGYDMHKINKIPAFPITMLYVKDGGFKSHKKTIIPNLNDSRINELVKFYKKNKWDFAYSLEGGIIQNKDSKKNIHEILFSDTLKNNSKLLYSNKAKYYTVSEYEITETFHVRASKKKEIPFSKGETFFFFQHRSKLPDRNCFLWEYFSIRAQISGKNK